MERFLMIYVPSINNKVLKHNLREKENVHIGPESHSHIASLFSVAYQALHLPRNYPFLAASFHVSSC